jgi:DNA uptake protein ComE-like DNA-binding protein
MKRFVAGLGLGFITGLLVAPKRGKRVRANIRRAARGIAQRASGTIRGAAARKPPTPAKRSSSSVPDISMEQEKETAVEVLNTASREALITVHGIGQVLADRIIENRPYERAYEVVERGILPESTFVQLRRDLLDKSA